MTGLRQLILDHNQLTTISPEIVGLTGLQELYLNHNQLATISPEIGGLTSLRLLNIFSNQLTTIPHNLFSIPSLQNLSIENNRITAAEIETLCSIPHANPFLRFDFSVYDSVLPEPLSAASSSTSQPSTLDEILTHETDTEKREALRKFVLTQDGIENFKDFLTQCSRTKSWENSTSRKDFCNLLLRIIVAASENEETAKALDAIALGSGDSCGDRVAMTLVDMQLRAFNFNKQPNEMSPVEMMDYAKNKSAIEFLKKKAAARFKKRGGDEIEIYLAYMQLAPILGIELKGLDMLYRSLSGVSEDDLASAESEYYAPCRVIEGMPHGEYMTLTYMLDSDDFAENGFINRIRITTSENPDFDTDKKEDETGEEYLKRMQDFRDGVKKAQILLLRSKLQRIISETQTDCEIEEEIKEEAVELDEKVSADHTSAVIPNPDSNQAAATPGEVEVEPSPAATTTEKAPPVVDEDGPSPNLTIVLGSESLGARPFERQP